MNEPYPPDGSPWYGQIVPVRFGSSFKTIAEQAVVGPNVNVAGGGGAFCAFTVQAKKNTTNQNSISSNAIRFFISFSFYSLLALIALRIVSGLCFLTVTRPDLNDPSGSKSALRLVVDSTIALPSSNVI